LPFELGARHRAKGVKKRRKNKEKKEKVLYAFEHRHRVTPAENGPL
jgi:hypothetical protein